MNAETDYLNFLKIFFNEDIYLFDEVFHDGNKPGSYVEKEENTVSKIEEPDREISFQWSFIGNENAAVAFIIDENASEALPESIRDRFTNLLKNLNLDLNRIFLANVSGKSGAVVENKITKIASSKIILLGIKDVFPFLADGQFQQATHEDKQFLFAPSFSEILKDKNQVKAFWEAMKKFL